MTRSPHTRDSPSRGVTTFGALVQQATVEAIGTVAEIGGILLDPVHIGKAMTALISGVRKSEAGEISYSSTLAAKALYLPVPRFGDEW